MSAHSYAILSGVVTAAAVFIGWPRMGYLRATVVAGLLVTGMYCAVYSQ